MTPVHIRFGGYQPPTSVHSKAAAIFGQALVTRLGDAVRFDLDGDMVVAGHKGVSLTSRVEARHH